MPDTLPLAYTVVGRGALAAEVIEEPVFIKTINGGLGELQLHIDRRAEAVTNLSDFDLIEVRRGDGTFIGRWKYEGADRDEETDDTGILALIPLVAEMSDVDFGGDYTAGTGKLGIQFFSTWVRNALSHTLHCTEGDLDDDGVMYPYTFMDSSDTVMSTVTQAVSFGGVGWWWYCDGNGAVTVAHDAHASHALTWGDDAVWANETRDLQTLKNVIHMTGGTDPNTNEVLTSIRTDATSINAVGRRTMSYAAPGVSTQQALDTLGDRILGRALIPLESWTVRVIPGHITADVQPGDQVTLTGTPGGFDPPAGLWVTEVREYGSTGVIELTIATTFGDLLGPGAAGAEALNDLLGGDFSLPSLGGTGPAPCAGLNLIRRYEGTDEGDFTGANDAHIVMSQALNVDSPAGCAVYITADVSVKVTGGTEHDDVTVTLMMGSAAGNDDRGSSMPRPIEVTGGYQACSVSCPTGAAAPVGSYVISVVLNPASAGHYLTSFDVQVFAG